jgi:hypothetical protein
MVIGQEKICRKIQMSTLDTFPRTLMLVGEKGAGKHMLCTYACAYLGLPSEDITEELTLEKIEEITQRVEPYMYIIRVNDISVKEENTILKFLEEPTKNSFIMLLADTENGILQTILNRCTIWHLQHYTKEVLMTFTTHSADLRILDIARTPGMVLKMNSHPFGEMLDLANKIVNKIGGATLPNTLSLTNKMAFKNEKDKYDIDLFVEILLSAVSVKCRTVTDAKIYSAYELTSRLSKAMHTPNVDKKALFDSYLVKLREIMRGSIV